MSDHPFNPVRCIATLESGGVQRYHAVPSVLVKQRVDSHAWSVAMIVLSLTDGQASQALLIHALLHDSGELITGDIPFTVKRKYPEVKRITDEIADDAHQRIVYPLPAITEAETAVLKIADTLDGWRWCQMHEPRGPVSDRWLGAWRQARFKFGWLGVALWNRADCLFETFTWRDHP